MNTILGLVFFAVALPAASFDTASIKPSPPGSEGSSSKSDAGWITMRNVTLRRCIIIAYQIRREDRILGGPKWLDEKHYDIDARAEHPDARIMNMLQALLADRFQLVLHTEKRSLQGFALIVTKSGMKAKPSPPDTPANRLNSTNGGRGRMDASALSMEDLANRLVGYLNMPVMDATGLPGYFDFGLRWNPEDAQADAPPSNGPDERSLFTALQEQLGLKLEPRKVPTDMLVDRSRGIAIGELNMRILLTGALFAVALLQAASFEAASIKPSEAATGSGSGIDSDNGLLRGHNVTLMRCIVGAYGVPEAQVLDGPKWIGETRFDITAKSDHPAGDAELMTMLQSLLADRFKLALHHDARTISGYALTVAKGGIKAKVSDAGGHSTTSGSRGRIDAVGCPMSRLIIRLSAALGVPVTDMTDDKRSFDFTLQWVPEDVQMKTGAPSDSSSGPSLFTALQEQLGLKLEARKLPLEVLVIDHAELPSEN